MNDFINIFEKKLPDFGGYIKSGFIKKYRAFPIIGDVTEFDLLADAEDYIINQFAKWDKENAI